MATFIVISTVLVVGGIVLNRGMSVPAAPVRARVSLRRLPLV